MRYINRKIKNILGVECAHESSMLRYFIKLKYCVRGGWYTPYEVYKRSKIDIFDYKALAQPLKFYPFVPIDENNLYGNGAVIKKAFKNINLIETTIEHGLYLGSYVPKRHLLNSYKNIITYSEYRKHFIEVKANQKILTIGPYITYADTLLSSKKISLIRQKFGRTLLVFPSHSIDSIHAEYDIDKFIGYIKEFSVQYSFDKVLICLYWKDISLDKQRLYVNAGFDIVTAGHIYDPYFLSRLKTIILLADATLTNSIGTHVGYAVSLDKPTQIWNKTFVSYHADPKNEIEAKKELEKRQGLDLESYTDSVTHISSLFSDFDGSISPSQRMCIEYYWGKS